MAKKTNVTEDQSPDTAVATEAAAVVTEEAAPATPAANFTMTRHMKHPNGRTSYRIEGQKGNLVIFDHLFMDGPPDELILNVELLPVEHKPDREAERAARLKAKAEKAEADLQKAMAELRERQAKAEANKS